MLVAEKCPTDVPVERGKMSERRSSSGIQGSLRTIGAAMAHYPVAKPYAVMGRDGLGFFLDD
jgi:hypothetical protein